MDIKFIGYSADRQLRKACNQRENPMELKNFYNAVNQDTASGCSCCKKDTVRVYAIQPVGIPQIKPSVLSLCAECLRSLSTDLMVINIDSNGAPPALIYRWCEV
jgi:hypothetical protein